MSSSEGGTGRPWVNDIHQGDVVETLAEMPESAVHCVMTSPPYFGLRDYGAEGQIGLEESLDEYIESLVDVADEIQRVLREDGSWWLNLGDSFAGSGRGQWDNDQGRTKETYSPDQDDLPDREVGLRRKSKMLVPHRVAIALEDAGWIVRADAVWSKPNPMPHPVSDRLNETKEFIFHLTPEPDYWFDLDAIREPHKEASIQRSQREDNRHEHSRRQSAANEETLNPDQFVHPNGKNPGDVLDITVKPFSDAHFAVFPPELCETPIKSSCPPKVCVECGAPYERTGEWEQACNCPVVGDYTEPGIVLDPFAGAGTTCLVAKRLGRRFVGVDLNPEYVAMAQKRAGVTVDEPERLLGDGGQTTLAQTDGGRTEAGRDE